MWFVAVAVIVLIILAGIIGGSGLLSDTKPRKGHDHIMSRLVDWLS